MLVSDEKCLEELRCPVSKSRLAENGDTLVCTGACEGESREYPVVDGKPVLIDFENSVVDRETVTKTRGASEVERADYSGPARLVKRILSPENRNTRENIRKLTEMLHALPNPARLLVIGGGSVGRSLSPLYDDDRIEIYSFDIYASPTVQFVADAHKLPLADDFFDAVIVQAVLEHVLEPDKVVAEIWRVLKADGLVYAETPFMQHVHEGAYDFTRYTESGHRYLFRNFSRVDSGVCGGPGMQLMWSVDYFARSLFRSRAAGKLAKLAFSWAQIFDRFIPPEFAVDAASGIYFLGKKSLFAIGPEQIITHYMGRN